MDGAAQHGGARRSGGPAGHARSCKGTLCRVFHAPVPARASLPLVEQPHASSRSSPCITGGADQGRWELNTRGIPPHQMCELTLAALSSAMGAGRRQACQLPVHTAPAHPAAAAAAAAVPRKADAQPRGRASRYCACPASPTCCCACCAARRSRRRAATLASVSPCSADSSRLRKRAQLRMCCSSTSSSSCACCRRCSGRSGGSWPAAAGPTAPCASTGHRPPSSWASAQEACKQCARGRAAGGVWMRTAGVRCCCAVRVKPYTSGDVHCLRQDASSAGHAKLPDAGVAASSTRQCSSPSVWQRSPPMRRHSHTCGWGSSSAHTVSHSALPGSPLRTRQA